MNAEDKFLQLDPNRVIDQSYFDQFIVGKPQNMRDKILCVTIDDIGRVGPTAFNSKYVCEALGVSPSLINHHFESRDELIAEAAILTYQNYVCLLWEAVSSGKQTPEARLRTWIRTSVLWSQRMSGWGALLMYPTASLEISKIIDERYKSEMSSWAELNMARLYGLVKDLKNKSNTQQEFELNNIPKIQLMSQPKLVALTASVGWSILGMASWSAGRHLPTSEIEGFGFIEKRMMAAHVNRIIKDIKQN